MRLERDRARLVPETVDPDVQSLGRQGITEALRPFDQRDAARLALIEQTTLQGVLGPGQPVRVDVEERQRGPRTRPSG